MLVESRLQPRCYLHHLPIIVHCPDYTTLYWWLVVICDGRWHHLLFSASCWWLWLVASCRSTEWFSMLQQR